MRERRTVDRSDISRRPWLYTPLEVELADRLRASYGAIAFLFGAVLAALVAALWR